MKKITLILIAAFSLFSCVKKEEEEIVKPYICRDCIEIYKIHTKSYTLDTIFLTRLDTIKFEDCGYYNYQNSIGDTYEVIYEFDSLKNYYPLDSLGNFYIKGWLHKYIIDGNCKYK